MKLVSTSEDHLNVRGGFGSIVAAYSSNAVNCGWQACEVWRRSTPCPTRAPAISIVYLRKAGPYLNHGTAMLTTMAPETPRMKPDVVVQSSHSFRRRRYSATCQSGQGSSLSDSDIFFSISFSSLSAVFARNTNRFFCEFVANGTSSPCCSVKTECGLYLFSWSPVVRRWLLPVGICGSHT